MLVRVQTKDECGNNLFVDVVRNLAKQIKNEKLEIDDITENIITNQINTGLKRS